MIFLLVGALSVYAQVGHIANGTTPEPGIIGRVIVDFHEAGKFKVFESPTSEHPVLESDGGIVRWYGNRLCKFGYSGNCSRLFYLKRHIAGDASLWLPYFKELAVDGHSWYLIKWFTPPSRDSRHIGLNFGWVSEAHFPTAQTLQEIVKAHDGMFCLTRQLDYPLFYDDLNGDPKGLAADPKVVCNAWDLMEKGLENKINVQEFVTYQGVEYVKLKMDIYICDPLKNNPEPVSFEGYIKFWGEDSRSNIWVCYMSC